MSTLIRELTCMTRARPRENLFNGYEAAAGGIARSEASRAMRYTQADIGSPPEQPAGQHRSGGDVDPERLLQPFCRGSSASSAGDRGHPMERTARGPPAAMPEWIAPRLARAAADHGREVDEQRMGAPRTVVTWLVS
jgi:hypothetical protein